MNLIEILRDRLEMLPPGEYTIGLRAVLQHVQVATNHLARGETTGDETAFTDAVYRTNQAFEGSLKEAYRVLAGKDPAKVRPFDIENFFQEQGTLRSRVRDQFTRYRTEWRNPSTHDYRLDFDEDEALLAIVSVCAFAVVLADQIAEKLSFESARAAAVPIRSVTDQARPLADEVAEALLKFRYQPADRNSGEFPREFELIGALAGYLTASLPGLQVAEGARLTSERHMRADLGITLGDKRLIIEVKRSRIRGASIRQGIDQLARYMALSGIKEAILYIYADGVGTEMHRDEHLLPEIQARIIIVSPATAPEPA
jgi:hypothetical protein